MGFSRQEYWSGVPSPSPMWPLEYILYFYINILFKKSFIYCLPLPVGCHLHEGKNSVCLCSLLYPGVYNNNIEGAGECVASAGNEAKT